MNKDSWQFSEQWAWERLGAAKAWKGLPPGAPDVLVAVVDSGVADNHADLKEYLLPPGTVIPGGTLDEEDHGTPISGTICALTNNATKRPHKAKVKILSVKFCSQQVVPRAISGADAIDRATRAGARVISLPWDVGCNTNDLGRAIKKASDAIVVVAAGNLTLDNDLYPNWPANYGDMDHVITVMATDKYDDPASFSSFGKKSVHIAAPGVDILSTVSYCSDVIPDVPIGYRLYSGTSAAAAHVAGLAAYIRAKHPKWRPQKVKQYLMRSARRVKSLKGLCASAGIAQF